MGLLLCEFVACAAVAAADGLLIVLLLVFLSSSRALCGWFDCIFALLVVVVYLVLWLFVVSSRCC